ncbi:MAG: response regulator transcription factor [Chloroflexota bacterium]|nr:response regulator transcription factor [Chloroflexota bacterium]
MAATALAHILAIGKPDDSLRALVDCLVANDFECTLASFDDDISSAIEDSKPDLLLIDIDAASTSERGRLFARKLKTEFGLPVIVLLAEESLPEFDFSLDIDDFAIKPCRPDEIIARAMHILWRNSKIDSNNLIEQGDLVIDLTRYEVLIAGRVIDLSFKEYELLKVLVSNRGRVLTRQALLDKVWGYDYFGGDRTVDVHIRRLRSKIEDADHCFVETVRNVGYKFKRSD